VFGEVAPFGAEERRMLHAERRICTADTNGQKTIQGAIILHVLFEYETLPFMTSQNPYFEVVRAADTSAKEGTAGGNVEVAIYGWGLQPVYTSGRSAWPITDELFARCMHRVSRSGLKPKPADHVTRCISRTTVNGSSRSATPFSPSSIISSISPS
jgi:hypothetical protein